MHLVAYWIFYSVIYFLLILAVLVLHSARLLKSLMHASLIKVKDCIHVLSYPVSNTLIWIRYNVVVLLFYRVKCSPWKTARMANFQNNIYIPTASFNPAATHDSAIKAHSDGSFFILMSDCEVIILPELSRDANKQRPQAILECTFNDHHKKINKYGDRSWQNRKYSHPLYNITDAISQTQSKCVPTVQYLSFTECNCLNSIYMQLICNSKTFYKGNIMQTN